MISVIICLVTAGLSPVLGAATTALKTQPSGKNPPPIPEPGVVSQELWNRLLQANLTPAGAAALLANIQAESDFDPYALDSASQARLRTFGGSYTAAVDSGEYTDFPFDNAGYGLAQWSSSGRKQALLRFAKSRNASVGNPMVQIGFIIKELTTQYTDLLSLLRSTNSTTNSTTAASNAVIIQYLGHWDMDNELKSKRAAAAGELYTLKTNETLEDPKKPENESSLNVPHKNSTGDITLGRVIDVAKIITDVANIVLRPNNPLPIPKLPDGLTETVKLALEVWEGKWGDGEDRKRRLTEAGHDYQAVQWMVNTIGRLKHHD